MTDLGWAIFLIVVLVICCWPLGRIIVRGVIRRRRLAALTVPIDGGPLEEPELPCDPSGKIDWREAGRQDYWAGKRLPTRLIRLYPYQDRYSPEDEREFLAGWREAETEDREGQCVADGPCD